MLFWAPIPLKMHQPWIKINKFVKSEATQEAPTFGRLYSVYVGGNAAFRFVTLGVFECVSVFILFLAFNFCYPFRFFALHTLRIARATWYANLLAIGPSISVLKLGQTDLLARFVTPLLGWVWILAIGPITPFVFSITSVDTLRSRVVFSVTCVQHSSASSSPSLTVTTNFNLNYFCLLFWDSSVFDSLRILYFAFEYLLHFCILQLLFFFSKMLNPYSELNSL